MLRLSAFMSLVFLSALSASFADEACYPNKEASLILNDTVVKKNVKTNCANYAYAFCVQTVRTVNFVSSSTPCEAMTGSDIRITPVFLEELKVDAGISEDQVQLAVKNPGKIIQPEITKKSLNGFLWLFEKTEKRGVIYNPLPPKKISFAEPETETSLSLVMLISALLIILLSVFVALFFNKLRENKISDEKLKDTQKKKFGRVDSPLGRFCIPLANISFLALFFCLYEELTLFNLIEQRFLLVNVVVNIIMIIMIPMFEGRYYKKLYLPVWAVIQLCLLIGFLAGLHGFIFYLEMALVIFVIIYFFSSTKKIVSKRSSKENKKSTKNPPQIPILRNTKSAPENSTPPVIKKNDPPSTSPQRPIVEDLK